MKDSYAKSIPAEWTKTSKIFVALGDEHRQRIVLMFDKDEKLNVSQIANASTLSRPTVSHHLKILLEAGVLKTEKVGKEVFYWLDKNHLKNSFDSVSNFITKHHF